MGTACADSQCQECQHYPGAILPIEVVRLSNGFDPCPARQARQDKPTEQCGSYYSPVSGEEKGQKGVLVGDSPQTGPPAPQPPESPSPPLRIAPRGKQGAH